VTGQTKIAVVPQFKLRHYQNCFAMYFHWRIDYTAFAFVFLEESGAMDRAPFAPAELVLDTR
jgi:hypothetical protein